LAFCFPSDTAVGFALAEAGVPGFENVPWYALFVPAQTPAAIVRKLNAETVRVLAEPDLVKLFTTQGTEPRGGTPEELAGMMRADTERTRQVIRAAGIKAD
jgi:tripartite-type tricarboxylate transporter receptor subunit TctC